MTPNDELCLRIGRIARAHVEIDVALRRVYVTLATLDELLTTMQRTLIRVFAMNWALQHVLPFFDGSFVPGEDRDRELGRWLATMDGQFTLLEDGRWRVEGDRPDADGVGDG